MQHCGRAEAFDQLGARWFEEPASSVLSMAERLLRGQGRGALWMRSSQAPFAETVRPHARHAPELAPDMSEDRSRLEMGIADLRL
ncbi:hypothetical protein EYZ11_012452 [Aspergillus tanneri]|uniref:Uncharacterized protein n=1 Tax=Aspergillus tanneri TaxID=1220188 RepID=A0A4V3UMP6_9EURO|nr:hypothetical protein EYZ11_012452 [Aspergillus tanneri]